jgi:hypothetical protein
MVHDTQLSAAARGIGSIGRALVLNKGTPKTAARWLEGNGGPRAAVDYLHKADVGSTEPEALATSAAVARDIALLVRNGQSLYATLLRIGARRVPPKVAFIEQAAGAHARFLSPGAPAPLSSAAFNSDPLVPVRCTALLVRSAELMRLGGTEVDEALGLDLAAAVGLGVDMEMLAHDTAAATSTPGGLGNASPIVALPAQSVAGLDSGVREILQLIYNAGATPASAVLAMHPSTLLMLQAVRSSGAFAWPTLHARAPSMFGVPVVPTLGARWAGSPSQGAITAVDGAQVRVTGGDTVEIAASEHAAIEMSDAPTMSGASGSGASVVSMYQIDGVTIRATGHYSWRAPTGAVATLTGAAL